MKNTFFKASGRNLLTCAICALMAMPASSQQALSLKDYEYTTREWKRIVRNSPTVFSQPMKPSGLPIMCWLFNVQQEDDLRTFLFTARWVENFLSY